MPGGLLVTERDSSRFKSVFKSKLKLIWQTTVLDGEPRRMADAFIDNTVVTEEVIHKIVEVPMLTDEKMKKKKDKKRSSSDDSSIAEDEILAIKEDIKLLKSVIKKIKKKSEKMKIADWFKRFDKDGSDEIELNEFIAMMQYIEV